MAPSRANRTSRVGGALRLLLLLGLFLGGASNAQAAGALCSDFTSIGTPTSPSYLIDGNDPAHRALLDSVSTLGIDADCTLKDFPESNPLDLTLINFNFEQQQDFIIVFDNVSYVGGMSCQDPTQSDFWMWWVNGSYNDISTQCQAFVLPVDAIRKENPTGQTTAAVGVPFTYKLTFPQLVLLTDTGYEYQIPVTDDQALSDVHVYDDLTATGADLTYLGNNAYLVNSDGTTTNIGTLPNRGTPTNLHFTYSNIPPGAQLVVEIQVVLDNSAANVPGTTFINTATWTFDKTINGIFKDNLTGQNGVSEPMTIVGPDLVMSKASTATNLNVGTAAPFELDVENVGGSNARNATVTDILPSGMCNYDPTTPDPSTSQPGVTAQIRAADGSLVADLSPGTDYTVSYSGCQLGLTLLDTPAATIGPNQHLSIAYKAFLDAGISSGTYTNVAGATRWFNEGGVQYDRTLTDGTPGVTDFQDAYTITAAVAGYYFLKSVENLTTGTSPSAAAFPGDRLRYTLQIQNFTQPTLDVSALSDELDAAIEPGTLSIYGPGTDLPVAPSVDPTGGANGTGSITVPPFTLLQDQQFQLQFDVTLKTGLSSGTNVTNQALISGTYPGGSVSDAPSDDPYVNGPVELLSSPGDPTVVRIVAPSALSKQNPPQTTATIGEQFSYRITVPASPVEVPLYDVRILDDLGASAADLRFVGANVVSGGTWSLSNIGTGDSLVLADTATGIDIPAGGQAVIEVTVELENTAINQNGLGFSNTASYTYSRINGGTAPQLAGGASSTAAMTVVEPDAATASKSVRFVQPAAKTASDPATVGDVLEYVVTVPNTGTSTAYDTNIVDTLPANVALVPGSATARINNVAVAGFVADPTTLPGGALAWGRQNGDETLDIPAGQSLVLTYRVTVQSAAEPSLTNSVHVDWTSLEGSAGSERTGDGCPNFTAPDDYCAVPTPVTVGTTDSTSIAKAVIDDSYAETPASSADPVLRVGDTATYELTLSLNEYTTQNVVVEDTLPVGMALESFTIDQGGTAFAYTLAAQPAAGDTGTLVWDFGDITNPPDGTPVDQLVIRYVAKVVTDAPPTGVGYATSIALDNQATLSYTGGDPAVYPARLTAAATIEVRQPQMSAITKLDVGSGRTGSGTQADPYQVDIASDVMNFRLSSCNNGLAPAYGVVITDQLASQLDETDLGATPPVVRIGTTTLAAGADYDYVAPARGGEMRIALLDSAPVNPGECVTVEYAIGFHDDITVSTTWSNEAHLAEYRSLPPSQAGRVYTPSDLAAVWMTNLVSIEQLLKTLVSPASGEATVGDEVVYRITVPAVPVNATLNNVVVTDDLHAALTYESATAVVNGASVSLSNTSADPARVILPVGTVTAGQQAVITLRARVANNDQANAGTSFANSASYTYTDMPAGTVTASTSGPLAIVEPRVTLTKTASPTAPRAGDLLTYTLSFAAAGAGAGDEFSDAHDLTIEDSLGLGLVYEPGSATVNGAPLADPATNGGDGIGTAQTLTWSPADGIDVDIPEGQTATITYQVRVLAGVSPGQTLTNSAIGRWTGLDGDQSAIERTGTGSPAVNDYFTAPASLAVRTQLAVSFAKSVVNQSTGQDPGDNAQPGDTLRYTLVIANESVVPIANATVVDELAAQFAPGSLQVLSVSDPSADTGNSDPAGGANGTGIVDIRNLTLAAQGDAGDTVTIEFLATLAPVIQSGTTVLNEAQLTADGLAAATSNQTSTLISSAPAFDVWKTSADLTGDPAELRPGDTLRYTIRVKNVGTEDAVNAVLRDQLPANTSYVPGSTTLNGSPVADQSPGVLPLQNGIEIHTPMDPTPGVMPADAGPTANNVATVTFDVVVNGDVFNGTVISNQGFLSADGAGSGAFPQEPTDDPDTAVVDDPTRDVVGNMPLIDAHKTVSIATDGGSAGSVDPGDVLRYTIVVTNTGASPATNVVLVDAVPANTTYVPDSVTLNGEPVGRPDGGSSPLAAGIPVSSSDLTPPLPGAGEGTLSVGGSAVVTFDVTVNAVASGTIISNQGVVRSSEQLDEPTDADGIDSNGDQPTEVAVGDVQQLAISKEVFVVGSGTALPGATLEYVIRTTNIGSLPASNVVITDNLDVPVPGQLTYVAGSGTLDGLPNGVSYAAPVVRADYASTYGPLAPGATAVLRFRARIDPGLAIGETITNTAEVSWGAPAQTASASVSIDVGGTPGAASLAGRVWHDANFNLGADSNEAMLAGWSVDVYRSGSLLGSVTTDASGAYRVQGLAPNDASTPYELRFRAPGAGAATAALGLADSSFTNGPQRISDITAASGSNLQDLNLPITPNGVVYDSVLRTPIAGAAVTMLRGGVELPSSCFDDPAQQNQITSTLGYYKFDINFSDPACPAGGDYTLRVAPPATGFTAWPSRIIPPASDAGTPSFSVPACLGSADDAISATADRCEITASELAPAPGVAARSAGTTYHLHLRLDNNQVPGESQAFNNHIPVDPELDTAIAITKTSARVNVSRGQHVPYTITLRNTLGATLSDLSIVDTFPAGFKYVEGSARLDGNPAEPVANAQQLTWNTLDLAPDSEHTIKLLFIVGGGVTEGEYVNRAQVVNNLTGDNASGEASATVRVVPDPTFDCTDIIGKVFDDANLDGVQDGEEKGLAGVRLATARGLLVETDEYGRFHLTCAVTPNETRGSNFIMKLDDRSLPSGYRVTTENPRVQRATRGKMMRFNFGATLHRVIRLDVADGVFEPDSTTIRLQWTPRLDLLFKELRKSPSVLRISYLADVEEESLVERRLDALREEIASRWQALNCCYPLTVEVETFWRRGAPPKR